MLYEVITVGGRGSRLFDGEGLATKKRTVFDKGVLKTYSYNFV